MIYERRSWAMLFWTLWHKKFHKFVKHCTFFARKYVKRHKMDQKCACNNLGTSRSAEWPMTNDQCPMTNNTQIFDIPSTRRIQFPIYLDQHFFFEFSLLWQERRVPKSAINIFKFQSWIFEIHLSDEY